MTLAANALRVALGRRGVLDGVSVVARAGEIIGLIGPNGAGKTTLLRALAGLVAPRSGTVTLDGRRLAEIDPRARGRAIGYLPQDGTIHWSLKVRDVVAMGRLPHRAGSCRAVELGEPFGFGPERRRHLARQQRCRLPVERAADHRRHDRERGEQHRRRPERGGAEHAPAAGLMRRHGGSCSRRHAPCAAAAA